MDEGMVSLKFQKRLAAGILQCGRGKVWLANGVNKISMTDFRQNTRKLVKDGFIIRKPSKIYSKSRARWMKEAKRKEPPPHQTRHQTAALGGAATTSPNIQLHHRRAFT
nr:60S ribosomal protein L19-like [Coffea arabica]